jgi:hypothetical protein
MKYWIWGGRSIKKIKIMKTTITLTIDFEDLEIDADYHKPEKQTLEHEGCEEGFEINSVKYMSIDLGKCLFPEDYSNINKWLLNEKR